MSNAVLDISSSTLAEALVETLETMAFISVLPAERSLPMPADALLVSIRYHGAAEGIMDLATSAAFGALLAENMLGPIDDPALAESRSHDALKELLNVVCGTILRGLSTGPAHTFEMNIPHASDVGLSTWQSLLQDPHTLALEAEAHPLALRMRGPARA